MASGSFSSGEERRDVEKESSVYLPEDLLIEILSWLPVISLLHFRSVSKTWKYLIDQPFFISFHHSKMKKKPHLLVSYYDNVLRSAKFLVYPDETLSRTDNYQDLDLYITCHYPPRFLGPCNGIFAVCNNNNRICNNNNRIALWNPATKQFRPLPDAHLPDTPLDSFHLSEIWSSRMGFGFDSNTHDYKLFWYRKFGYKPPIAQLLVYSLNADSWNELDHECLNSVRIEDNFEWRTLFFNGVLYLIASRVDTENKIVGPMSLLPFDLSDEQFQDMIPMPNHSPRLASRSLAACEGCIAILDCNYAPPYLDPLLSVCVWVMVEKGHWVYKFQIGPFEGVLNPMSMWRNHYVIIETNGNELLLCDSFSQIWKSISPFESENLECYQAFAYSESLVSVKS